MLLLVLALWKRVDWCNGVLLMSVRSIGGIYDEGDTRRRRAKTSRRFEGFLSFVLGRRRGTGRGAGGRARRARVLGRRTPVNPPSLTGRRPDASATSLCARWSGAREAGVSGGSGLEHDRRARTRVACFSQAVGTARRGLATTRRRRKGARRGYRVGTDAACVPEPSQRLLGVREFHLRVRGVLRVRLRARGRRPRRCRNTLGRAHRARVEAARRERERRTRARTRPRGFSKARERRVPIGLEMDARASVPRRAEMRSAGNLPARVQSAGRRGRAETKRNARVRVFAHTSRRGGSDCWSAIRIDDTGGQLWVP